MAPRNARTEAGSNYRLLHDDLCNLELAGVRYGVEAKIEIMRLGLFALITRRVPVPDRRTHLGNIDSGAIPKFSNFRARWGRSDLEMLKMCQAMYDTKNDAETVRRGLAALAKGKIE